MQNRGAAAATAVAQINNEIPLVHVNDGLVSIRDLKKPVHPVARITSNLVGGAEAINLVQRWIKAQFPKAVAESWWADKLTANIKNLGLVIGKQYRDPASGKVVVNYRVDWDPEKGLHFNINTTDEKFVFRFGFVRDDVLVVDEKVKINMSKNMTISALKNERMPFDIAFQFIKHVKMSSPDLYFTEVLGGWVSETGQSTLLMKLYTKAEEVLSANDKENDPTQNGLSGPKMG